MKAADKLSDDQRRFIEKRVVELGSLPAVESFYRRSEKAHSQALPVVDRYARYLARRMFRA